MSDQMETAINRTEQAVLEAAVAWWESKRPLKYDLADHLASPGVNASSTERERTLAMAVAAYVDRERVASENGSAKGGAMTLLRDWDAQIEAAAGDEVVAAVGILRCSQRSHQEWLDWIQSGGEDDHARNDGLMESEFHRRCIDQYERIIELIERLATATLL